MPNITVQHLLSHSRLLNQLIAQFNALPHNLDVSHAATWEEIQQQAKDLSDGLLALGLEVGAGNFPNTFVRNGVYMFVNDPDQETAAIAAGWVVATFPQIMVKTGAPDLTVHNSVEKARALDLGYTLPGLPAVLVSGA